MKIYILAYLIFKGRFQSVVDHFLMKDGRQGTGNGRNEPNPLRRTTSSQSHLGFVVTIKNIFYWLISMVNKQKETHVIKDSVAV